jgi:NAD(P)-dependent dehydrogenase (short-subunit alcohol dehydrogenase family)
MTAATLLRPGALDGRAVVAGGTYAAACAEAGATIVTAVAERVDVLVVDAAPVFGDGGLRGLRAAVDGAWSDVLTVAGGGWLAQDAPGGTGAALILVAPRPGAGEHAGAAASALENLARTLAVEWARFGVRATAVAPGPLTPDADVAQLVAFLASAGGAYFSGCRFDLR